MFIADARGFSCFPPGSIRQAQLLSPARVSHAQEVWVLVVKAQFPTAQLGKNFGFFFFFRLLSLRTMKMVALKEP